MQLYFSIDILSLAGLLLYIDFTVSTYQSWVP
jgi:hypothetical protein